MDAFTCCVSPILLGGLFFYSLIQCRVSGNPDKAVLHNQNSPNKAIDQNLVVVEEYEVTHNLTERWSIVMIVNLSIILFAVFCFVWFYFTNWIIYWQLFYLKAILEAIIVCTMIATILVVSNGVQQWSISKVIHQMHRTQRGQLGMAFTMTGAILWIAVLPYLTNDFLHTDSLQIEKNTFNLVYVENIEDHAHFELYKCGWQSIFCQQVAESRLDHCRSYQSSRLNYDPMRRELSAEVITCFKYTGLMYVVE